MCAEKVMMRPDGLRMRGMWAAAFALAMLAAGCRARAERSERELPPITLYASPQALGEMLEPAKPPQTPVRVAIVMVNAGSALSDYEVRQDVSDETIVRCRDLLARVPEVSSVEYLPEILVSPERRITLDSLRYAAAARGCAVLLVFRVQRRLVQVSNPWALGYITIVGALFIPGTECLAESRVEALLVDCVSGRLYGDLLITGHGRSYGPLYFQNTWRARALSRATEDAMTQMKRAAPELLGALKK